MAFLRISAGESRNQAKIPNNHDRFRDWDDFDLKWTTDEGTEHIVFILDDHERLDMKTSSKPRHHGHHVAHGPAFVHVQHHHGMNVTECHVNDPRMWHWIRRSIAEGYLSPTSIIRPDGDFDHDGNDRYLGHLEKQES